MQRIPEGFYLDIGRVLMAHKFVLDGKNRCDYSSGRRVWGVSYAIGGEAEYRFSSGARYKIRAGDVVYLPANTAYTIVNVGEYHHYTVNFTLHTEHSDPIFEGEEIIILFGDTRYYASAMRAIVELWQKRAPGYEMRTVAMLYELISSFAEQKRSTVSLGHAYMRLLPAKEYIDADPTRVRTIEELASLCNMSKTTFRRSFLSTFGQTPMRYRDTRIVALAKEKLLSGFYSVSEVAEALGFEDASYFGRFFKKNTGKTPGQFKEQL